MSKTNGSIVTVISEDQMLKAARRAVNGTGCTIDELRQQAQASHFTTDRARRVWLMVSPLADRL